MRIEKERVKHIVRSTREKSDFNMDNKTNVALVHSHTQNLDLDFFFFFSFHSKKQKLHPSTFSPSGAYCFQE